MDEAPSYRVQHRYIFSTPEGWKRGRWRETNWEGRGGAGKNEKGVHAVIGGRGAEKDLKNWSREGP